MMIPSAIYNEMSALYKSSGILSPLDSFNLFFYPIASLFVVF